MATRTIRTARWIPDDKGMKVTQIDRGEGLHELVVSDTQTVKEIQCFPINRKKVRKNDKWVYHSVAIASLAGGVAVLLLPVIPLVSVPVILASLAWLGFVGYANVR